MYLDRRYVPAVRPTKYIAPVGAGTPPSGSIVTAIAVGLGRSTGVSKMAAARPLASGRNNHPLLIGGVRAVSTHSWYVRPAGKAGRLVAAEARPRDRPQE